MVEWKQKSIGELANIISGGTPSTTVSKYWNGNIIWVAPTDITKQKSKYLSSSERRITEHGLANSSTVLLPTGTILLCTRATIGESSIAMQPTTTNQGFKNLVCFDKTYNEWLYYAIQPLKSKMIEQASGSTFLEISKNVLCNIEILTPPLPEQHAIAAVLSDIDELITALKKLISKKKAIKQGAMQELLTGKRRLEGFSGEWVEKKLEEVLTVNSGRDYKHLGKGDIPVYGTGGYMLSVGESLSDVDGIGIGRKGTIDKPQYLKAPYWTVDTLFYLTANDGYNVRFLYYMAQQINWSSYNEATGVPSLSRTIINEIEQKFPLYEEQTAIAEILSDMDEEINSLMAKLNKYKKIKQGMMSELLTGKIRLEVEDNGEND